MDDKNFGSHTYTVMNRLISIIDFLRQTINDWLGPDIKQVFITNINDHKLRSQTFYCVVLSHDEIQFSEKDKHNRLTYTFNLDSSLLKKNDSEVDLDELEVLVKKLQVVINDIKDNNAKVYEKST